MAQGSQFPPAAEYKEATPTSPSKIKLKMIKKFTPNLKCFTPGIRQNDNKNDQKRTMNAKQALEAGSDCLIIGRPITKGDPKKNIEEILSSLK